MWYAAHVIEYFKYRKGRQTDYLAWENVYLVEADSPDEAWEKAEALGRAEAEYDDPSLTWGGRPVQAVFGGVRKVIECLTDARSEPLAHGTEVTYSALLVKGKRALNKLIAGKSTPIIYDE